MKKFYIKINRNAIMEEVSLATSYAGAKSEADDGSFFGRVAVIDADTVLIQRFWIETCGLLIDRLQPFISSTMLNEEELKLDLELSDTYDETANDSVNSDLFAAVSSGVIARWFRYSYPQRAMEWQAESQNLLDRAFRKLCHRLPPRRK